ncbi:MAG TPA: glutamate formimidoyltransferase [Candidatus Aminicenantes bacterium]|nr:glutamate formimidoyltransferase [Candidatus Aminicenantes bacterium]HRY65218.1 glutamate formimidoyltransferase [Candidatus Aminicenantes bacterium]HRZ72314.1 glutamate formimidoyltransferase [Candidatus Aminicenantes bacterium]
MKLVECVPNFSEGRDPEKIRAITREIEAVPGAKLLDVDPGASTNRTVVTFIGPPEAVAEAAFRAIARAAEVIDMRSHTGAHPRLGATDVCPFVPVSGVTMEDCADLAGQVGRRVADELGIPVYLYEAAARKPERRNLATVRAGEYEGLAEKLKDPRWAPDFGPAVFNARSGATIIGAREFLIAYNFNLNTRDRKLAHEIALSLRESGRAKRDKDGNILKDSKGNTVKVPGKFKEVKSVGWYVEDYGVAQISVNFTNYRMTPIHVVFDEASRLAAKLGLRLTGSELVGLIPKEALLMAGRYYLEKQGKNPGVPETELIRMAVRSLGLSDVVPFEPEKKIIEYQVREPGPALVDLTLRGFADELSMDSPAPGGGSVAALCGALAAGLAAMVANLTVGKKGYEAVRGEMIDTAVRAQALKDELLEAVDLDTKAFNKVMEAFRLPKTTPEQAEEKGRAVEAANKEATLVPLGVLEKAVAAVRLARRAAGGGNRNSISDAGVAGLAAQAAGDGAYYNVLINLQGIGDAGFAGRTRRRAAGLKKALDKEGKAVREIVARALAGPKAG